MSTSTYAVQGMTCTSCAGKVTGAVNQVAGVTDTSVDLESSTLIVTGQTDGDTVRAAIRDAGYQVS
ncbi:MAG: Heavy metal transport/detoxification protein [Nocardioides sp.]|nr:Heavy metal transport/detoxification protein [Nocardioides sp.]